MNADKQVVPIVEEDQGEGWSDPIEDKYTPETCSSCKQTFVRKLPHKTKKINERREFLCPWCSRQQKSFQRKLRKKSY